MNPGVIVHEREKYIRDFEVLQKAETVPNWITKLRQNAFDRFLELDFPTTKIEDWRFTNITQIIKSEFRAPSLSETIKISTSQIEPFFIGPKTAPRLVFVNGYFQKSLSSNSSAKNGIKLESLSDSMTEESEMMDRHLSRYALFQNNIFTALNTAFLNDGAMIYVPDGVVIEEPIQILFVSTGSENRIIQPRVLLIAGKQSVVNVAEMYVSLGGSPYLTNSVTEIVLDEGAIVEHYKIQSESTEGYHIGSTYTSQDRDSSYSSLSLTFGARLSRNEVNVLLNGTGANCSLNGLYLINGLQHADHQTSIDHAMPYGTSQELYKGIMSGKSHAIFNGKIVVRKNAQRTDARQTNKNLLLSDDARVNTKPQLEILADDVKCSHGATIGHLEKEALFYLKSRGLSDSNARTLLMYGFINDVLMRLKSEPVKQKLDEMITAKLQAFVS